MVSILPKVNQESWTEECFPVPTNIAVSQEIPEEIRDLFIERLTKAGIRVLEKSTFLITYEHAEDSADEEYELFIQKDRARILASNKKGLLHALTSMFWLLQGETLHCGTIHDRPQCEWRGFMLDVSRHFFSVEEVKKLLEQCALLKINKFHFHVSDDSGYRLESTAYPLLNTVGAYRTLPDGTKYGGYYTKQEIQDLVKYAGVRGIDIIPEIDMPGHALAMIASYPELSCSQEKTEVNHFEQIEKTILCAGKDSTYSFLHRLIDEICEMFPGNYIHIGGDEVPKDAWIECPDCRKKMEQAGLENDPEMLQTYFTAEINRYVTEKGKTVICWNEAALTGKLPADIIVQYWNDLRPGTEMFEGTNIERKFIFSNVHRFYSDYGYGLIPLQATYEYSPSILGKAVSQDKVLGVEMPLWTEYVSDTETLEYRVFPRLCATAENGWTKEKDYTDFCNRLNAYEKIASMYHVVTAGCTSWNEEEKINTLIEDAMRMKMAEKVPGCSTEENLVSARRKLTGWLTYLQGQYYTEEERETFFEHLKDVL